MSEKKDNDSTTAAACLSCAVDCPNLDEIERLREEVRQLADLVRTDELTGLFNFRYFSNTLEMEMERTRRSGQPTALIMFDLDFFKDFNDVHGHEVGNKVLSHVAEIVRVTLRRLDSPCRYGGEEFAIILPDTSLADATGLANRLRLIIENTPLEIDGEKLNITASFGVDFYPAEDKRTLHEFIEQVDSFLYQAKQAGRNRVRSAMLDQQDLGVNSEERDALFDEFTDTEN